MPVVAKQVEGKWRVVNADTGEVETNAEGTPVDGGGHATQAEASAQARAINASKDELAEQVPTQLDCEPVALEELGAAGAIAAHATTHRLWNAGLSEGPLAGAIVEAHVWARQAGEAADRKSTRLNSSHSQQSRMPSSA